CRKAARSSPMSMKADCMPGSTRATLPRYTLPTSPRSRVRSTCSSCTAPLSTIATRVSCGDQFTRMSCCMCFSVAAPPRQDNAGPLDCALLRMAMASTSDDGTPYFLQGGGAMGERLRACDWANHPMGPPAQWPQALGMAMALCLNSSFPTAVYWGHDLHILYNDAWAEIPAE